MWVVFRDYDGYECAVERFATNEEAEKHFEELKEVTFAQMYLAKVEDTFNVES